MFKRELTYFGGGTVDAVSNTGWHKLKRMDPCNLHVRFENGTPAFLEILAIEYGFNHIETRLGGWSRVSLHADSLAKVARSLMRGLVHGNGSRVVQFYVCKQQFDLGPIVNFNLKNPNGSFVGNAEVLKLSNLHDFVIRCGCFCNLGYAP